MIACYPPARRNQALTSLRESSPCQRILPVASNWSHSLGNVAHRCGCRGGCYDRRSSRSPRPQTCHHNDRRSVKAGRVISVARPRHDRCGDGILRKRAAAFDTGGGQSKKVGLVGTSLEPATHSIATPTSRRRAAGHASLADEAGRQSPLARLRCRMGLQPHSGL